MAEYKKRYGVWSGNQWGAPPDRERCAEEIFVKRWYSMQCSRKAVTGPENAYCKQHAKKREKV